MSSSPRKAVDPETLEDVHDALWRILKDRRQAQLALKQKDQRIARLEKELDEARRWQARLHEKCMALEAIPGGVLDAWDEQYLMDHNAIIEFKRLGGGRIRTVLSRLGYPKVIRNGSPGEYHLREILEEASGRKRASPTQQEV